MSVLITIVVSFLLTVLIGRWLIPVLHAMKAGQSIREIGPKWHQVKAGTPTMGGLMFMAAALICVVAAGWTAMLAGTWEQLMVLGFSLIYGAIGFIDDFVKVKKKRNLGLTALQKLLLQIAAAVLFLVVMRVMGYLEAHLYIPFVGVTLRLPWLLYLLFSVVVILGADNAVNLTDGIDGLCASVTFVVALFFSVVFLRDTTGAATFALALAGGLLGFFLFNKNPARVFMGDTGSLFLGGAVCAMAFAYDMPLILVPVGMVYIIETLSVIIQVGYFKLTHGKRFFKMAPFHHHLEMSGWSEWKIVIAASALTALLCAISLLA